MGLFDKIDKEKLIGIAKDLSKGAKDLSSSAKSAMKEMSEQSKEYSEKNKELKAPVEGAIQRYGVIYLGGLTEYKAKKSSEIGFNILPESFYLKATVTSQDWFDDMAIPYASIEKLEITTRTLSNTELLLTNDARGLETDNNIEISYKDSDGKSVLLRLEMLTGGTVAGQAVKCKEFMDVLRANSILDKFVNEEMKQPAKNSKDDVIEQIKKISELKELGILSDEEFTSKKSELLQKL